MHNFPVVVANHDEDVIDSKCHGICCEIITYDDVSQFATIVRSSNLAGTTEVATSTYTFDVAGYLTALDHTKNAAAITEYDYLYNAGGIMTDMDIVYDSTTYATDFTHDDANQLTDADFDYQTDEGYTYDETGNRINDDYEATANQVDTDGTFDYDYDDEGNLVLRTRQGTPGGGQEKTVEYTWDYRNRLTNVTYKDTGETAIKEIDYTYDVLNNRIISSVDADGAGVGEAVVTNFVYDGEDIVAETTPDGENFDVTHRYLHGPATDQILADENHTGTPEIFWALADHQGTVRDVLDSAGAVENHIDYDSFGNVTAETDGDVEFRFGYTGRELDTETGLNYYRARYYDPSIGRFISEDPIGFDAGDMNLYRYVANTPMTYTDPSGMCQSWMNTSNTSTSTYSPSLNNITLTNIPEKRGSAEYYPDGSVYSNVAGQYFNPEPHRIYVDDLPQQERDMLKHTLAAHNETVDSLLQGQKPLLLPFGTAPNWNLGSGLRYAYVDDQSNAGSLSSTYDALVERHAKVASFNMTEMGNGEVAAHAKASAYDLLSILGVGSIVEGAKRVDLAEQKLLTRGEGYMRMGVGAVQTAAWLAPAIRSVNKYHGAPGIKSGHYVSPKNARIALTQKAGYVSFAKRARLAGLTENPHRPGSWGMVKDGKFMEIGRVDVATPGTSRWAGKTHMHIEGSSRHLPITTKLPGE
jgi:RHS repeat-associated protein